MPDPMWEVEPTKGDAFIPVTRRPANGHRTGVRFTGFFMEEIQRVTVFTRVQV